MIEDNPSLVGYFMNSLINDVFGCCRKFQNQISIYRIFVKYIFIIGLLIAHAPTIYAQQSSTPGDPIVIRIIELEYADAEQLAETLKPLLSPQGRITAYGPSNSLIIRDRKSIVEALVEVIKGKLEP
jgi:type II secretory pathway component GspD/PulD (secretin)